ncbi:uncharacterized protein H6S33_001774 [Morchella sextelata]|uniref:uncharacterized protein n=1 Tax=Morchella sextelata TaxID=1174677 RepID=UPI001D05AA9D|nr:uncharacterized protein H6S33_001774 [Morchella sextelata]KAH0608640.1 hypothetical protein H6S33_001774 [Morchella sextelata]
MASSSFTQYQYLDRVHACFCAANRLRQSEQQLPCLVSLFRRQQESLETDTSHCTCLNCRCRELACEDPALRQHLLFMASPVFLETSSVANILKDDASFPYWVIKLIANIDTHVVKDKPKLSPQFEAHQIVDLISTGAEPDTKYFLCTKCTQVDAHRAHTLTLSLLE